MAEVSNKENNQMRQFVAKMAQDDEQFRANMMLELEKMAQDGSQFAATMAKDLTKMELEYQTDVPGSTV